MLIMLLYYLCALGALGQESCGILRMWYSLFLIILACVEPAQNLPGIENSSPACELFVLRMNFREMQFHYFSLFKFCDYGI